MGSCSVERLKVGSLERLERFERLEPLFSDNELNGAQRLNGLNVLNGPGFKFTANRFAQLTPSPWR
jgi:hypothetical protein